MSWVKQCRKIVAIGRNYADHVKELGNTIPTEPMLFLKPSSSFITSGQQIEIPKGAIVHHELELGVIIGKTGKDISEKDAPSYISGYCLALDMTARNIQDQAKQKGHPWTVAKGFDTFTPVGEYIEKSRIMDPSKLMMKLKVDEIVTQDGSTSDMIFPISTLIEHVSKIMTLEAGDLILTGTPKGVGPVVAGQKLNGILTDQKGKVLSSIHFPVVDRK
jgi:acylpyruvate hydrolase